MKTDAMNLPFARSYWVEPNRLLAGFYPGDLDVEIAKAKLVSLLDSGVTHIINLMEAEEGDHSGQRFVPYQQTFLELAEERGVLANWQRWPIQDLGVTTLPQMVETLDAVDAVIAGGGCVYVHCWGGKGRTGTVTGCWLARHGEEDPQARLKELTAHARAFFPKVPETERQREMVQQWRKAQ